MIYESDFGGEHLTVKVHAVTDDGTCLGKPAITLEVSDGTVIQMTYSESVAFSDKVRSVVAAHKEKNK